MVFLARLPADGGPDRVRTDDLLDANQALSQLSYGPHYLPKHTPNQPRTWNHAAMAQAFGAAWKAG